MSRHARPRPSHRRGRVAAATALSCTLLLGACTSSGGSHPQSSANASSAAAGLATSINDLLKAGIAYANAGNYSQADATFNNVLVLDKGNKYAYYNLGVIAGLQKNSAAALKDYDSALATDASYTPALYNKAILLESSDLAQAETIYQQIIAINPKAATAYLRLSFAYAKTGNSAQAASARAKAIALDPSLATVATPSSSPSK